MILFTTPKTSYTNYYDASKFNILWNLGIILVILLIIISISNCFYPDHTPLPYISATLLLITSLIVLHRTRKFEFIGKITSLSLSLLIAITLFAIPNIIHYITPMWMILNVLFTFFVLGKTWGLTTLAFSISMMVIYFHVRLGDNITNLKPYTSTHSFNFSIEYLVCGAGIAYFLYLFVKHTTHAEHSFLNANSDLLATNTELTHRNEVIAKQKEEKEIMLMEIHHRVKNNLQLISSLLRLQLDTIGHQEMEEQFQDAIGRVNAMALIHEEMYKDDLFIHFDSHSYLSSLTRLLIPENTAESRVNVHIDSTLTGVSSKTIVPLALIFQELLSTSLKLWKKTNNSQELEITISLRNENKHAFQLHYRDTLQWPISLDHSFGMEIIDMMTQQLDGSFEKTATSHGTTHTFLLKSQNEDFKIK